MKLAPFELFRKELTIKTSYVNPLTQGRSVALLNAGMIELDRLVAEIIPLEKLEAALQATQSGRKGNCKTINTDLCTNRIVIAYYVPL